MHEKGKEKVALCWRSLSDKCIMLTQKTNSNFHHNKARTSRKCGYCIITELPKLSGKKIQNKKKAFSQLALFLDPKLVEYLKRTINLKL